MIGLSRAVKRMPKFSWAERLNRLRKPEAWAALERSALGVCRGPAGRNINNLRYVDDTTLMAESEEELKSLLMRVKGKSERAGLRINIKLISCHPAP